MNLGAHMSIAGGLHLAVERATEVSATALQLFVKNQRQWAAPPLDPAAADRFREARERSRIRGAIAHASYLVNLASPDDALFERSVDALADEVRRADALGLDGLVVHPGAHMESGIEAGLRRIALGTRRVIAATPGATVRILFETMPGAGTQVGGRFEEIARLVATSGPKERIGVCLDTCHVFAAGYDLRDAAAWRRTRRDFDSIVGLAHLRAVHLNDSGGALGSRLDRHAHIGRGRIGEAGFAAIVADRKLTGLPGVLETPKGTPDEAWDARNLELLRRLAGGGPRGGTPRNRRPGETDG